MIEYNFYAVCITTAVFTVLVLCVTYLPWERLNFLVSLSSCLLLTPKCLYKSLRLVSSKRRKENFVSNGGLETSSSGTLSHFQSFLRVPLLLSALGLLHTDGKFNPGPGFSAPDWNRGPWQLLIFLLSRMNGRSTEQPDPKCQGSSSDEAFIVDSTDVKITTSNLSQLRRRIAGHDIVYERSGLLVDYALVPLASFLEVGSDNSSDIQTTTTETEETSTITTTEQTALSTVKTTATTTKTTTTTTKLALSKEGPSGDQDSVSSLGGVGNGQNILALAQRPDVCASHALVPVAPVVRFLDEIGLRGAAAADNSAATTAAFLSAPQLGMCDLVSSLGFATAQRQGRYTAAGATVPGVVSNEPFFCTMFGSAKVTGSRKNDVRGGGDGEGVWAAAAGTDTAVVVRSSSEGVRKSGTGTARISPFCVISYPRAPRALVSSAAHSCSAQTAAPIPSSSVSVASSSGENSCADTSCSTCGAAVDATADDSSACGAVLVQPFRVSMNSSSPDAGSTTTSLEAFSSSTAPFIPSVLQCPNLVSSQSALSPSSAPPALSGDIPSAASSAGDAFSKVRFLLRASQPLPSLIPPTTCQQRACHSLTDVLLHTSGVASAASAMTTTTTTRMTTMTTTTRVSSTCTSTSTSTSASVTCVTSIIPSLPAPSDVSSSLPVELLLGCECCSGNKKRNDDVAMAFRTAPRGVPGAFRCAVVADGHNGPGVSSALAAALHELLCIAGQQAVSLSEATLQDAVASSALSPSVGATPESERTGVLQGNRICLEPEPLGEEKVGWSVSSAAPFPEGLDHGRTSRGYSKGAGVSLGLGSATVENDGKTASLDANSSYCSLSEESFSEDAVSATGSGSEWSSSLLSSSLASLPESLRATQSRSDYLSRSRSGKEHFHEALSISLADLKCSYNRLSTDGTNAQAGGTCSSSPPAGNDVSADDDDVPLVPELTTAEGMDWLGRRIELFEELLDPSIGEHQGTTLTLLLLPDEGACGHVWWVGDSPAFRVFEVPGGGVRAELIMSPHNASHKEEVERLARFHDIHISPAGNFVAGTLGEDLIGICRLFGNFTAKREAPGLCARVDAARFELTDADVALVVVSDGVTEKLQPQDVANCVKRSLTAAATLNDPAAAAKALVDAAVAGHSSDNCSAVVLPLKKFSRPALSFAERLAMRKRLAALPPPVVECA